MPTINNSEKKSLSSVFDKSVFNIPKYQRAYSWEENNWRELWDDIKNYVYEKDREHFLGAVIHYHGESNGERFTNFEIIDGQQRITTLTILMRVIYEKLKENNIEVYSRFADELYEKYIGNLQHENYFLNLSKKDQLFFRDFIQKISPNRRQGKVVSNKNIRKCYEFFVKKISELNTTDNSKQVEEIYWELKKKLETNLIFVVIDVNTDVDAYMIFESINSKRQGLTISDLLKNYIFSAADQYEKNKPDSKKLLIIEDAWDRMEQELEKIEINQYIRHFWISNYKKVFEKELYQQIKFQFGTNIESILTFFEQVVDESETYSSIVNASVTNFPEEGILALDQLRQLRNRQYYPLILSAIQCDNELKKVSELVQQIASVAVRRAIVGKNPNELETFFTENASKLRKKEISIDELKNTLGNKEYWINDEDVVNEIKSTNFEDQEYLVKFILKEFELSKNPANEKTLGKLSLEHILPRNPENKNDWNIDDEKQQDLLWNIGNLALIGQKYNVKMSNKDFSKKKIWLRKSELKSTSKISEAESWTEKEIIERNIEISNFIVNYWQKK